MDLQASIKNTLQKLLEHIGIEVTDIIVSLRDNGVYNAEIKSPDAALLIGYHGDTLNALQYLLRSMLRKDIEEDMMISVDVEGYKEQQEQRIIDIAKEKAEKVLNEDIRETMFPMNSYHRRKVHLFLAEEYPNIATESIGEEPNRRIILKKKEEEE